MLLLELLPQLCANALLLAGIYALMAAGLSIVFGVLRVLNMAHGEILMLGGLSAFLLFRTLGVNPIVSLTAVLPVFFALGYFLYQFIVRPTMSSRIAREDSTLMVTYGLSIVLIALARYLWSADHRSVPYLRGSLVIGDLVLSYSQMVSFVVAVVLCVVLLCFLRLTPLGMTIRATSQNRELAETCGIKPDRVFAAAMGIGTALAGAAGATLSSLYAVYPEMGLDYSLRAFVIVILGGLSSIGGAALGAALLALVEVFGSFFLGNLTATLIPFSLVIAVLLLRPYGLGGAAQRIN